MLIYNSKKEFLGIDESDLKDLGYTSFAELRSETDDFADLFVKTPGFIHNFKHVHWIDFITCADSAEPPKVIIHAKEKSYRANLNITTAYFTDNEHAKGYLVNLQNLRELLEGEENEFSHDIANKPTTRPVRVIEETQQEKEAQAPTLQTAPPITQPKQEIEKPISAPLDIAFEEETIEPAPIPSVSAPLDLALDTIEEEEVGIPEEFQSDYQYDPQIASDELGLPIDLIEEFIEDFIAQAKEFKEKLYDALNDGDIDNVKTLSHKLKGVAANLRIEDAFEVLTTINTSDDTSVIKKNLDHLYVIVAKLAGEEIKFSKPKNSIPVTSAIEETISNTNTEEAQNKVEIEEDADTYALDFKDDLMMAQDKEIELVTEEISPIRDSDVPEKIEVAELADDQFLNSPPLEIDEDLLAQDIELTEDIPDLLPEEELVSANDTKEVLELLSEEQIVPVEDTQEIIVDYNKDAIANEIGLDSESFNELFDDFMDEATAITLAIKDSIVQNDVISWKNNTLKLKGMCDNMRMGSFEKELDSLLNTDETSVANDALNTIEMYLNQISTKGTN